jgi:hypothetical protein
VASPDVDVAKILGAAEIVLTADSALPTVLRPFPQRIGLPTIGDFYTPPAAAEMTLDMRMVETGCQNGPDDVVPDNPVEKKFQEGRPPTLPGASWCRLILSGTKALPFICVRP